MPLPLVAFANEEDSVVVVVLKEEEGVEEEEEEESGKEEESGNEEDGEDGGTAANDNDDNADAAAEDLLICDASISANFGSSIKDLTFKLSSGMSKLDPSLLLPSIPFPLVIASPSATTPSKFLLPSTTLVVPVCLRLRGCFLFLLPVGDAFGFVVKGSLNDTDRPLRLPDCCSPGFK